MRVIFMGRKPASCAALDFLLNQGVDIPLVVALPEGAKIHWASRLRDFALSRGLDVAGPDEMYDLIPKIGDADLVISFLFWQKIKKDLIKFPKIGCLNFHPAPLPDFRGVGGYNFAIYEGLSQWGVSAHFVDESFDTGDIIKVDRFGIDAEKETAFSLEQKTQIHLLSNFKDIVSMVLSGKDLSRTPQGEGRYISKAEFESLRRITSKDSAEEISRKFRAFWYPPYSGAFININGAEFTVVDGNILEEVAFHYHSKDS